MTSPKRQELLQELLVETSRTFALSIPLLPEPTRHGVTVAYLLFRIADTFEDAELWPPERRIAALARFDRLLRARAPNEAAVCAAEWSADPPTSHPGYRRLLASTPEVVAALLAVPEAGRAAIVAHTLRTSALMSSFVARSRSDGILVLRDLQDLRDYCYAVAGVVGEMLTELFIADWELAAVAAELRERAVRFGEGLQLTNILKDSRSDARHGRSYVPPGVDRGEVFALARADLEAAAEYVRALQGAAAPAGLVAFNALPVLLARATLERVERDGAGSKITRDEVFGLKRRMDRAIAAGHPAV